MNEQGIPERADAIVIGAGALGAATAFHLAKAGLFVALLDKAELASQSSPRAAGLSGQLRSDPTMTRIAARGVEKIMNFQAETGEPMVFFQPGSLKIARRPEHEAQLHEEVARGRRLGLDVAMIPLDEARRLMPYLVTEGVRAVMHMRTDVYLEPVRSRSVTPGRARDWALRWRRIRPSRRSSRRAAASPACARLAGRSERLSWSTRAARGSAFWLRRADRQ